MDDRRARHESVRQFGESRPSRFPDNSICREVWNIDNRMVARTEIGSQRSERLIDPEFVAVQRRGVCEVTSRLGWHSHRPVPDDGVFLVRVFWSNLAGELIIECVGAFVLGPDEPRDVGLQRIVILQSIVHRQRRGRSE